MDARTQELLDRLVEPGPFPGMSCSEGHELHKGLTQWVHTQEEIIKAARALAEHITEASLWWDDPNGPYRCFLCGEGINKGHSESCVHSEASSVLSLIDHREL